MLSESHDKKRIGGMFGSKRAETLMFLMGLANKIAREMLSRPILSGIAMGAGLIEAGGGYCFRTLERGAYQAGNVLSSARGHTF